MMLEEMHMWKWLMQSSQETFLSFIPLRHTKTGPSLLQSSGGICFLKCLELYLMDILRAFRRVSLYTHAFLSVLVATCCFEQQVAVLDRPLVRQSLGSNLKLLDAQHFLKLS